MKFTFKLNESVESITFDNLDNYKDQIWSNKRNSKPYKLVGKFVGFDGIEYVALVTWNMFSDKSYITFNNFIKSYSPSEEQL